MPAKTGLEVMLQIQGTRVSLLKDLFWGPRECACSRRRQTGVAVVTALLLTTLAITIVASLFGSNKCRFDR